MSSFFFGPADRQLFGCYHPARGVSTGAVVICPSWGTEYQYAHRALRMLARRLAERGLHVLRFDYTGVGDSWGDTTDGDMDAWALDVGTAVTELRSMSQASTVDLVGLRIGAAVAASAATRLAHIRRVVLWDPVIDGRSWTRAHSSRAAGAHSSSAVEFGKQLVAAKLLNQLNGIDAESYPALDDNDVLVLETTGPDGDAVPPDGPRTTRMRLPDSSPWVEDQSIWSGLVPVKAIAAIADWLTAS